MAGSYILGATVKIPLQITEGGMAATDVETPIIQKIVLPSGSEDSGFPQAMSLVDADYAVFSYDYTPSVAGDYLVIITFDLSGQEYTALEHFVVSSKSSATFTGTIPRAVAR